MKRLLFALLKLLLQLLIFAVAGKWVRIGEPQRTLSPRKEKAQQQKTQSRAHAKRKPPPVPTGRGRLFDPTPSGQRGRFEDATEATREWASVELAAEPGLVSPLPRSKQRNPRKQARIAVGSSASELLPPAHSPLATALRSPQALREALIVGAALGPRRPRG